MLKALRKISDGARTINKIAWLLQLLLLLLLLTSNNCVHTDGDTAAATPRYERPLLCLCVRLLRVAIAAGSGSWSPWTWSLQWTGDWTLLAAAVPLVEWTRGYSVLSILLEGKEEQSSPTLPIGHRVLSLASPNPPTPFERIGCCARFRPASPIHPPQVCSLAPISGKHAFLRRKSLVLRRNFVPFCWLGDFSWLLQVGGFTAWKFSTAVGTFVPSWFIFAWIGLVRMGGGGAGIRNVWVRGRWEPPVGTGGLGLGLRGTNEMGGFCSKGSAVDKSPSDTTLGPGRVVDHHDRLVVKEEKKAVVGEAAAKRMQEEQHQHQQQQQPAQPPLPVSMSQAAVREVSTDTTAAPWDGVPPLARLPSQKSGMGVANKASFQYLLWCIIAESIVSCLVYWKTELFSYISVFCSCW